MPTQSATLYYIHDPMCSWCWGFRNTWQNVKKQLPGSIQLVSLVGGLAPDSNEPMPESMQSYLQSTWKRISQQISGTEFNFDFWTQNTPRRSTYPACRAVIAAKTIACLEDKMTYAIQQAYYLQAKNPSDLDTLTEIASGIGIDTKAFEQLMGSSKIHELMTEELQQVHNLGVNSFPSLVLQQGSQLHSIAIDYVSDKTVLNNILSKVTAAQA